MNFSAVIFDKDGVIIDTQPIHYQVFKDFCHEFNWDISEDQYESYIGMTYYNNRYFVVTASHVLSLVPEDARLADVVIPYRYGMVTKILTLIKHVHFLDR